MTYEQYLNDAVYGYIECLLFAGLDWSNVKSDDNPDGDDNPMTFESANYDADDITPELRAKIREELDAFLTTEDGFATVYAVITNTVNPDAPGTIKAAQFGHDFFLTRNRHGAGFWDRGLGEMGDTLTKMAHVYGETNEYVGDDGKIHEG